MVCTPAGNNMQGMGGMGYGAGMGGYGNGMMDQSGGYGNGMMGGGMQLFMWHVVWVFGWVCDFACVNICIFTVLSACNQTNP
jgi:hypothetical protein